MRWKKGFLSKIFFFDIRNSKSCLNEWGNLKVSLYVFWKKSISEHLDIIILILYHSHTGFENLWDINKCYTPKSHYYNKTSSVVYICLILLTVGHLPFAVDCPPSRNCPLDPTTKDYYLRREAGGACRAPPSPLRLYKSLNPMSILK